MKLALCVAIVLVSAAIGRQFAARMGQRLVFFREYQSAVTFLSDKVVGMGMELYKALLACQYASIKPLFDVCAASLRRSPQSRFDVIWDQALRKSGSQLGFLSKADMRILAEGGAAIEALCGNPSERQAGIYLKRLSTFLEELEAEKIKKCRLYNTAGLLCGLMIALLVV